MEKTTLNIKDIKSLKDIKYTDFVKFRELVQSSEDIDEEVLSYKILNIFYGIKVKEARALKLEQFELLISKVHNALQEETTLHNIIIMDGVEYGLIPNFGKASTGELIDMEACFKENKIIELLSILYRPIVGEINKRGEYRIAPYEGHDRKFKDISAFDVEGVMNFFMKSYQILSHYIHSSMMKNQEMNLTKEMV